MNARRYSKYFVGLCTSLILLLNMRTSSLADTPDQVGFIATDSMNTVRSMHTATLLNNGTVLVVGGDSQENSLTSAELYDPSTGLWSFTGSMSGSRDRHTATLLKNGKVLVVGGIGYWAYSPELYDPTTGTWSYAGSMNFEHSFHTATLLNNGNVLVAGGYYGLSPSTNAELYDPSTDIWTSTGSLNTARVYHNAILLNDGRVMVMGGSGGGHILASAELYDPNTGIWIDTGNMNTPRNYNTATLLNNGKVLVTGGSVDGGETNLDSAELYDPTTGTWSTTGSMSVTRQRHTATLLNNGKVLVAGGQVSMTNAELYDPTTEVWSLTGSMIDNRHGHTATLLNNGIVLVAGGADQTGRLASAELGVASTGYTLSVIKSGPGNGTVTSAPMGINCGSTCSAFFDNNTNLTLTATNVSDSYFIGWSGSGCSGTGTCTVTMDRARSVIATFHLNIYPGVVLYVKESGLGDCSSWINACSLQSALSAASSGEEIWVASGTYKPGAGADRTATFHLKNGVLLYGGFTGTETFPEQREPAVNLTILSGDGDNNDSQTPIITNISTVTGNNTNSYQVVTGANGATLDGFIITAGYADGPGMYDRGGGMYIYGISLMVTNVTFIGNYAHTGGGGIYNGNASSTSITNATFSGNSTMYYGGGMDNDSGSTPALTSVTFSGNSAGQGGGGIFNGSNSLTLTNVTFSGNSAYDGGGMYSGGSPTITNGTFSGNSATHYGGGMYNGGSPTINNTIFWGNTATTNGQGQIYNFSATPILNDSILQLGCPPTSTCTNIIITNPLLGTLGNYGGFTQTIPLQLGSSAIDAGNDSTCATSDQRGIARPQGAHCDIGAYELMQYLIYLPLVIR